MTIISRGIGALGYTIQRPTEDRFLMTREELAIKIAVLMAGRAAEKLVVKGLPQRFGGGAGVVRRVQIRTQSRILQLPEGRIVAEAARCQDDGAACLDRFGRVKPLPNLLRADMESCLA